MSENKGKDGDARVGIVLHAISCRYNDFEITRPTITNQSDLGADYNLRAKRSDLLRLVEIGTAEENSEICDASEEIVRARLDVKATNEKLTQRIVEKFISDVKMNPESFAHFLVGGCGLTKGAEEMLKEAKEYMTARGKIAAHISNEGVRKIANEFKKEILDSLDGPVSREEKKKE